MPRKRLIRTHRYPYHVTTRSNNQEWFYIPMDEVWKYAKAVLFDGAQRYNVKIDAFVLMSNHYHLCIYTPDANIDRFMQFFNKRLGQRISRHASRINRIFGAPYKWSLIQNDHYYSNVIRYIYQNPLRAGLCVRCEDYPYSDLTRVTRSKDWMEWVNSPMVEYNVKRTKVNLKRFEVK